MGSNVEWYSNYPFSILKYYEELENKQVIFLCKEELPCPY